MVVWLLKLSANMLIATTYRQKKVQKHKIMGFFNKMQVFFCVFFSGIPVDKLWLGRNCSPVGQARLSLAAPARYHAAWQQFQDLVVGLPSLSVRRAGITQPSNSSSRAFCVWSRFSASSPHHTLGAL